MTRSYRYVGPQHIAHAVAGHSAGHPIQSVTDLERWIQQTRQQPNQRGLIVATFIIAEDGVLYLADRYSEHVACAGGSAVRSAGEMSFAAGEDGWEAREVSNQSTGYCPEPASWQAVVAALADIPLPHPDRFTQAYLFRCCPACHQLNLVKEDIFVCAICDAELPTEWNCEAGEEAGTSG
ncbi:MAG TPA: hypothetical protein VFQ25_09975 [Ktedonobacterales bacterium]|nr:hypothetical protein [Ktedonobacterales bacterium]